MQAGLGRTPVRSKLAELEVEQMLKALSDRACRQILTTLQGVTGPMTAQDLSEACDVPLSATYRKVGRPSEAVPLDEKLQLRANGTYIHQYRLDVESVTVSLNDDRGLEATLGGDH